MRRRRSGRFGPGNRCEWWPSTTNIRNRPVVPSAPTVRASDRKSTRLNSSHSQISYAVFCLKKKKSPAHIRLPAPTFSEHNRYVFCELLGRSDDEIVQLEADGIIGSSRNQAVHH